VTPDLLDDLRRANPVDRDELEVPAPLVARVLGADTTRRRRTRVRRLTPAVGAIAVAAAAAVALLLARGPSPDLAARAYAATTGAGIVHWRIDLSGYADGRLGSRQRSEGWSLGTVTHILRSDIVHGQAHVTVDERDTARRYRVWMSGADDWSSGTRLAASRRVIEPIPSGDPLAAFHRAYRAGRLRNLGGGRFEVPFPHLPAGTVVYQVDQRTGRPRRLVVSNDLPAAHGRPATRSLTVVRFSVYETLPATTANRAKLALLAHPGAGPGKEPASRYFAVLRTGSPPTGASAAQLRGLVDNMAGGRFRLSFDGTRALADGVWLIPGQGYVCIATASTAIPASASGVLRGIGAGCVTIRKARRQGVANGLPSGVLIAVPDGVSAIQARLHWHGPWQRYAVTNGLVRLPGLGYQSRLVH
jgi:hypothetical protein